MKIMKTSRKTKQQLLDELAELQERISRFEARERESETDQRDFGERINLYFPRGEHANEAIYVIFDRKYEFVNEKFTEMFGHEADEICSPGFDMMTLVAPESRQFVREKYRQGYRGEFSTHEFEFTGLTKEGLKIECETLMLVIPYKWGVAIHGMLRDISVQRRINEELRRQRSDLQIVLNSIPTSVFYTDTEHRFVRVNKWFCKSIGFPIEQIIGKTFEELFPHLPAEQLSHFYEMSNRVMSSGHPKRGLIEILPSVRGRRWIQNDRLPYFNEQGKVAGVISLAIDISDIRETEEKLQYLSFHDVLTGLYNRTYFEEEMYRLENSRLFPICVAAIKVEDLHDINEREGIAAGNDLLKHTAGILKTFRTEDMVARIAGDKFAALLPMTDMSGGKDIIKRLEGSLKTYNDHLQGTPPLRLSFGLVCGEKGCKLVNILKQAESTLN
jgi:diguanylate cyclase (GGDEF)-like protein/PAS domain S-box-containing protein